MLHKTLCIAIYPRNILMMHIPSHYGRCIMEQNLATTKVLTYFFTLAIKNIGDTWPIYRNFKQRIFSSEETKTKEEWNKQYLIVHNTHKDFTKRTRLCDFVLYNKSWLLYQGI